MIYIYSMIFVTGGTGLIGAHLLYDLVKKNERVRALHRKESSLSEVKKIFSYYTEKSDELFSKIEWTEGDLLDVNSLFDAMEGITHVYHCAAMVSMNPGDAEKMIHNNLRGTTNMVNAAIEKKIQKFCHVSSVAALGIEFGKEINEETHWNGKTNFSAYAVSKYLSENEVWRASQEGLNTIVVNPTVVVGPGNWRRSSGDIFLGANRGLRWYTGGGIGYVDARDVSKTMQLLMESTIKNEKFIITSENLPHRKFMDMIYIHIGKKLPDKKAGRVILEAAWRLDKLRSSFTGTRHILTKEIARYSRMNLSYSNAKIKQSVPFDFIPVSESVKHTAHHFLSDLYPRKK